LEISSLGCALAVDYSLRNYVGYEHTVIIGFQKWISCEYRTLLLVAVWP